MKHKIILLVAVALIALTANTVPAQTSSVFVTGLKAPEKIIYAQRQGYFLVSEAGIADVPNSGRISIITNDGQRFTLLDGLPSGPAAPSNDPSGPSALLIQGNKLYIAIGTGNETINGPAPGSEIPNPNPNSPLFSSVLEYSLPTFGFRFGRAEFNTLTSADHARLANGETVFIGRPGLLRSRIRLIANFPDFTPNPRPDVPNNVRNSNPFGLVLHGNTLYVADAAQNNIRTVDLEDGSVGTLITYPARMNPTPVGAPFIDPVPDSLRLFGNKLLVTFLTGFPFPAGQADVRQYDLESGEESQLIGGLSSAIDVLPVSSGFCSSIYTLEFSTNMLMGAPGRIQRFDAPNGPPTVIANNLISPTSMARHPASGDFLVTEIFPGRITRISNP
ncbi:MAG: ScyD/ScyE family protein [Acidobacteriota bacterium]